MSEFTDRIERKIRINAPPARVWQALIDPLAFGQWFGVQLAGQSFVAGQRIRGQVTASGYEHLLWEVVIEEIVPQRRFSWRWHPAAVDVGVDYSTEPTTLVVFALEADGLGTVLSVVESGFDQIPPGRRLAAFRMNSNGWDQQMNNIDTHVSRV